MYVEIETYRRCLPGSCHETVTTTCFVAAFSVDTVVDAAPLGRLLSCPSLKGPVEGRAPYPSVRNSDILSAAILSATSSCAAFRVSEKVVIIDANITEITPRIKTVMITSTSVNPASLFLARNTEGAFLTSKF